jgi:hypothetical protein
MPAAYAVNVRSSRLSPGRLKAGLESYLERSNKQHKSQALQHHIAWSGCSVQLGGIQYALKVQAGYSMAQHIEPIMDIGISYYVAIASVAIQFTLRILTYDS